MKTSELVQTLDLYGQQINMQIFGKERKTTIFGALMGLISLALMGAVTVYFLIGLFERKTKQIIQNQDVNTSPINDMSQMPMFLGVRTVLGAFVPNDGSIFNLYAFNLRNNYSNGAFYGAAYVPIPLRNCTVDDFGSFPMPAVAKSNLCLPLSDSNSLRHNINDAINGWNSLIFILARCNPSRSSNCAPQKTIDASLESAYFSFATFFSTIDNNNLTSPGQYQWNAPYLTVTSTLYKKLTLKLTQNLYQDDNGFIFESFETHNFFTLGEQITDYATTYPASLLSLTNGDIPVGAMTVTNTPYVMRTYRSYMKAQAVLANIGGIIKFIMVVAGLISQFATRKLAYAEIANKIFVYGSPEPKIRKIKTIERGITNEVALPEQRSPDVREDANLRTGQERKKGELTAVKPTTINIRRKSSYTTKTGYMGYFKLSLWDILCPSNCAKNKKMMSNYELTRLAILNKASINSIMSDSYRLDELCKLTLDESQYKSITGDARVNFFRS